MHESSLEMADQFKFINIRRGFFVAASVQFSNAERPTSMHRRGNEPWTSLDWSSPGWLHDISECVDMSIWFETTNLETTMEGIRYTFLRRHKVKILHNKQTTATTTTTQPTTPTPAPPPPPLTTTTTTTTKIPWKHSGDTQKNKPKTPPKKTPRRQQIWTTSAADWQGPLQAFNTSDDRRGLVT